MLLKYHHDTESPFYQLSAKAAELKKWKPTSEIRVIYSDLRGANGSLLMQKLKRRKAQQMLSGLLKFPCKIHLSFIIEPQISVVAGEIVICHKASETRIKQALKKIKAYAKNFADAYPHTELVIHFATYNHPTKITR